MRIVDKLNAKQDIYGAKPVTIAFLGDSVTQGCFECYIKEDGKIETIFENKSAFGTRLREMLGILYPSVQINIINSGISGDGTENGKTRIERDILPYSPDLVVVSYGLNDACKGLQKLDDYRQNLKEIFKKVSSGGAEVIFLTQNAMNTKKSCHLRGDDALTKTALMTANIQNDGVMKAYMDAAKEEANKSGVKVCDIYPMWEKLIANGVDTTELLANKINHPIREIHYYMAMKLLETIFE
ncbi:MAG: GDSL family lipase [Ruminococcaceae bacterium]|nr:GDSL family lipase [Oscillospiraceae bacterium]